jgi:hypothetical protein
MNNMKVRRSGDRLGKLTLAELDQRFRRSRVRLVSLIGRDDGGYSIRVVYDGRRYYGTGLSLPAAVQDLLDELATVSAGQSKAALKTYSGKQKPGRPRAHHEQGCECWYCQRGRKEIAKATAAPGEAIVEKSKSSCEGVPDGAFGMTKGST